MNLNAVILKTKLKLYKDFISIDSNDSRTLVQIWQLFSKVHFKMQYLLIKKNPFEVCFCFSFLIYDFWGMLFYSIVEQNVNVSSSNNLRRHFTQIENR